MKISELPKILNVPKKLHCFLEGFNKYLYFLLEGGRAGGKTWTVARVLLYLGEKRRIRVVCGREIQNTIEESVYTVLKDTIAKYSLNYEVFKNKIVHLETGTEFGFKGLRDMDRDNIKGLEGVDILWIDESQSITQQTLDIIVPTIRKDRSRIIFTMNRFLVDDPVYKGFSDREDCLHAKINWYDNEFCSEKLKNEALRCKEERPEEYRHIWEGEPLANAANYLFSGPELEDCYNKEFSFDASNYSTKILSLDVARFGGCYSSMMVINQVGPTHWSESFIDRWQKQDTVFSAGKVMELKGQLNPNEIVIDGVGVGSGVVDILRGNNIDIVDFIGGSNESLDTKNYTNWRSFSYLKLHEMVSSGKIRIKSDFVIDQLREIIYSYTPKGIKYIIPKEKIIELAISKKIKFNSPDDADALAMAVSRIDFLEKKSEIDYHQKLGRTRMFSNQSYYTEHALF